MLERALLGLLEPAVPGTGREIIRAYAG